MLTFRCYCALTSTLAPTEPRGGLGVGGTVDGIAVQQVLVLVLDGTVVARVGLVRARCQPAAGLEPAKTAHFHRLSLNTRTAYSR